MASSKDIYKKTQNEFKKISKRQFSMNIQSHSKKSKFILEAIFQSHIQKFFKNIFFQRNFQKKNQRYFLRHFQNYF